MAGYVEKGVIRLHEKVGHDIWRMQIELPQTAKSALPGQFIHIKINDPSKLLRRPISIAGIEPGKGLVEIIYRIVGNGTEAMAHMKIGDVVDSLGPLGTSFSMDKGHIVGVGGGASAESDEALRERIAESYYNPSNGDNEEYYRRIALGVDGVYSVGIKPLAQGTGTVGVYIAGRASKCSDEVVSALQQEMNDKKGINISVSVENATLTGVVIKLSISVKDGYYADDVKSKVQNEITEYFRKLCVGDGVKYCELGELIYHIDGVKNYIFDTSVTKEYEGDCTKLYTLGAVSITVV